MIEFNYKKLATSLHILVVVLLLASCAQVVAPNGGKKDVVPPIVVKYTPDSAQLNFNSKSILIELNEYAQLKDVNTQLIISPPLSKTPDVSLKNKSLTIHFQKDEILKANTTYSINFGNSIQDITENNPMDNFKYIFSTGNFIDSLAISGKVVFASNLKTEKGIMVMLYSENNDSSIYKSLPDYFAKTNENGFFQINNIRAGWYKIIALKDLNANYKYDNEAEFIGFTDTILDVSKNREVAIQLFQELPKKVMLKKYYHNSYGKISLFFNQGSDSIRTTILNPTQKGVEEFFEFSKNKDTLQYWVKNYSKDSLKLQVNNGKEIIDTLDIEMINFEKALKNDRAPLKLNLMESPIGNQNVDLNIANGLSLVFSNPIDKFKTENILLKEDSLVSSESVLFEKGSNLLTIQAKILNQKNESRKILKENMKYSLLIPEGTFTDIFGLKNDSIKIDFKTREQKHYGTLKLSVSIPEIKGNYIVQLMDEKETALRESILTKSETLFYEYLQPLKYKLKIIKDENGNGKWDTGNYIKKTQAEKVVYNPELIQIRSNWDAELEWKIAK